MKFVFININFLQQRVILSTKAEYLSHVPTWDNNKRIHGCRRMSRPGDWFGVTKYRAPRRDSHFLLEYLLEKKALLRLSWRLLKFAGNSDWARGESLVFLSTPSQQSFLVELMDDLAVGLHRHSLRLEGAKPPPSLTGKKGSTDLLQGPTFCCSCA